MTEAHRDLGALETAPGGPAGERPPVEPAREGVAPGSPHPEALTGRRLAERYDMLERLGAGGMGVVYRARQLGVERDVAIKVVGASMAGDADALGRFRREARLLSNLRHPHLVTVHDFGVTDDGLAYLVMEMLQGRPLADLLAADTALSLERALTLFDQACAGLEAAHAQGTIHRDLKPDNLFVERLPDGSEHLRVLDFGLARSDDARSLATAAGAVMGTPAYMAPEQARGEATDARTDLYQLGVVLFQMVSGRRPFLGPTPISVMVQHLNAPPPSLDSLCPGLPPALSALAAELLEKDPDRRPQSMREVRGRVAAIRSGAPGPAVTPGRSEEDASTGSSARPRRAPHLVVWAAAAGLVAGLAVWGALRFRDDPLPPAQPEASRGAPPGTDVAGTTSAPAAASSAGAVTVAAPATTRSASASTPARARGPSDAPRRAERARPNADATAPPATATTPPDLDRALERELSGMTR
jgi:serine/threonine-protein kinase